MAMDRISSSFCSRRSPDGQQRPWSFIGPGRPCDWSAEPDGCNDARGRIKGQAARFKAFGYQGGVFAAVAVALAALSGCTGEPTPRDLNDATPPSLLLTVTASKAVDGGLQTVEFGGDIELKMPGGSVFAKASDDDGVSYVELWMTETRVCGGTKVGPGLAGAPTKRVEGQVTDTSAPSSLSAGHDINTQPLSRAALTPLKCGERRPMPPLNQ